MDPISQSVLGAVATQNISNKKNLIIGTIIGLLSGLAADLDVFINSNTDPLLSLEYHRQFTHSLIFIPIGGLICATVFYWLLAKRWLNFRLVYIFSTMGYATHPFLDAFTSYGTQLFWPFSDARISIGNISIIDPVFTLPIVFFVIMCMVKRNLLWARVAVIWTVMYLSFGLIQKFRVESIGYDLALSRGHVPDRLTAKPSFGNILLWKNIYEANDTLYVDAIRAGLSSRVYSGDSIKKLNIVSDFPWMDLRSQQAQDIERFRWFTDGLLAQHPDNPNQLIDIRYSIVPNEIGTPWKIEIDRHASPNQHVRYTHQNNLSEKKTTLFFDMLFNHR